MPAARAAYGPTFTPPYPPPAFSMPAFPSQASPFHQAYYPAPLSSYQEPMPLFVAPYTPAWSYYR